MWSGLKNLSEVRKDFRLNRKDDKSPGFAMISFITGILCVTLRPCALAVKKAKIFFNFLIERIPRSLLRGGCLYYVCVMS